MILLHAVQVCMCMYCVHNVPLLCISHRTGGNSTSQEMDLGQRRGTGMQLVVSIMASNSLNYWFLGEGTDRTSQWQISGFLILREGTGGK